MLDKPTIEIDNVKRSVRAGGEVHWMKPWICRGQKLFSFLITPCDERHTVRREDPSVHQIAERCADECVATIFFPERIAPINRQTSQRIKMTGRFGVEDQGRRFERKHPVV